MNGADIGIGIGRALSGSYKAYTDDKQREFEKQKEEAQQALEQKRLEVEQTLEKLRGAREDSRYEQNRRDDSAKEIASTIDPWSEVDDQTATALQGTPYEGRIASRKTLPSTSGDPFNPDDATSDPGGHPYRVWTPTAAETRQTKTRQDDDADRAQARQDRLDARAQTETDRRLTRTDQETARSESFDDWVKREEWSRAHPTAAQTGGKDDPEMPRGVESYLYDLSRKPGNTFEAARAEVDSTWEKLIADHPKLDRVKVNQALRGFFQADPKGNTDALAGLGIEPNAPTPSAPARAGGPGPVAASVGGAPAAQPQQPRVVTAAQVAAVAAKNGTTVEQERKRAAAEGFVVR